MQEADFRDLLDAEVIGIFKGEKTTFDFVAMEKIIFDNWANELLSKRDVLEEIGKKKFDLAVVDGAAMSRHHYLVRRLFGFIGE